MDLRQAMAIIEAGTAAAAEYSCNAGIAVVDRSGDIVLHMRMDGATRYAADMAKGKAMVSAIFRQPSGNLTGEDAGSRRLNELVRGQLTFVQGAVPVSVDGAAIGAVGVSGSTGEIDEKIAAAAAQAVS
jgi:uncharacterized protein GlcG (DUF336 family)